MRVGAPPRLSETLAASHTNRQKASCPCAHTARLQALACCLRNPSRQRRPPLLTTAPLRDGFRWVSQLAAETSRATHVSSECPAAGSSRAAVSRGTGRQSLGTGLRVRAVAQRQTLRPDSPQRGSNTSHNIKPRHYAAIKSNLLHFKRNYHRDYICAKFCYKNRKITQKHPPNFTAVSSAAERGGRRGAPTADPLGAAARPVDPTGKR